MATWKLTQANAQLREVMEKAMTEGPQEITGRGKDAVMMVSKREWIEQSNPVAPQ